MDATIPTQQQPVKWQLWAGRALSTLSVLALAGSASMKLTQQPQLLQGLGKLGFSASAVFGIGVLELALTVFYAIPRTRVFGAVLLTGYFGGAVASHVRVGEPFVLPVLIAALAWLGLFLRDPKVRAVSPI